MNAGEEVAASDLTQYCELPGLTEGASVAFHLKYKPALPHRSAPGNIGWCFVKPRERARNWLHSVSLFQVAVQVI